MLNKPEDEKGLLSPAEIGKWILAEINFHEIFKVILVVEEPKWKPFIR